MKPEFEPTRIYSDGSHEPVQTVPLTEVLNAQMNRRGFFGAGLTAMAACRYCSKTAVTRTGRKQAQGNAIQLIWLFNYSKK